MDEGRVYEDSVVDDEKLPLGTPFTPLGDADDAANNTLIRPGLPLWGPKCVDSTASLTVVHCLTKPPHRHAQVRASPQLDAHKESRGSRTVRRRCALLGRAVGVRCLRFAARPGPATRGAGATGQTGSCRVAVAAGARFGCCRGDGECEGPWFAGHITAAAIPCVQHELRALHGMGGPWRR